MPSLKPPDSNTERATKKGRIWKGVTKRDDPPRPIKATSYKRWRHLLRLNDENSSLVDVLDFTDFFEVHGKGAFDEVFPFQAGAGMLDPPTEYLASGEMVRRWRALSGSEQEERLTKTSGEGQIEAPDSSAGGESSEGKSTASSALPDEETSSITGTREVCTQSSARNLPMLAADDNAERATPKCRGCKGITKQTIRDSGCKDIVEMESVFNHLVGFAYHMKADVITLSGTWDHGDDVVGFYVPAGEDSGRVWKCVQVGRNEWAFRGNHCCIEDSSWGGCCGTCYFDKHEFLAICQREVVAKREIEAEDEVIYY